MTAIPAFISIRGVTRTYAMGDAAVHALRGVDLDIHAGEFVAIVGPSGSGKTTLAKLLLGLLPPDAGTVRIGGIDIARYGLSAYRARVGAVMQDDVLFAGSVADNVAFFDRDALPDAVMTAAQRAGIHDEIAAMPMGYETLVGDMGSALSGGQKQRVLLARALFRNPDILVLDEATSHLDVERERRINAEIAALRITRLIIAHRPETIRSADRILMVADGRVEAWSQAQFHARFHTGATWQRGGDAGLQEVNTGPNRAE
jgi:ATP-binding cassette subfamily B protein RaxB